MNTINIKISNKIAICQKRYLISANSNYTVNFDFDSEWDDSRVKTARIIFDSSIYDRVFTGNTLELPKIPPCKSLAIGVYSDTLASTAAEIGCIVSVADMQGDMVFEFTESQYDQIVKLLNETDLRRISGITRKGTTVTVTYNDGSSDSFELEDGRGIKSAAVNENGELLLTLTDESVISCGQIKTPKSEWRMLNTVTLNENVDELTISADSDGKPFQVDELFIRATFRRCSETTAVTDVHLREARLSKNPLQAQGIFENALSATSDEKKVCYMKATGLGNCFSIHNPENGSKFASVVSSGLFSPNFDGITGVTLCAAADTGRIGKGSSFMVYGR